MILVQGCSFTYGSGLLEYTEKFRYSSFIERALNEEVRNISGPSKDNFTMYFELHAYLLHAMQSKVEIPRVIIWQLSDTFRRSVIDYRFSGAWKPNDLESLICVGHEYGNRHIKTVGWQGYTEIQLKYNKMIAEGRFKSAKAYKQKMGIGTKIKLDDAKRGGTMEFNIGDETFQQNELLVGMHVNTIQDMCKQLGIQLVIINYYGTPKNILEDPIYKNINRSNYLIKNSERWGMYNHLCWRGFDRSVDNFHFNIDAHYYQADVLLRYLKHSMQITVEETVHAHMNHMPVFDYTTNAFFSNESARQYLLNRAK
jgi:hypothetical protein